MATAPFLSVVSPVFQGDLVVEELVRRVSAAAGSVTPDFEIILVDDGSTDGSWEKIAAAAARDRHVRGLRLARNFGQHPAIRAGLDHAAGEFIAVMDCDLQDDPGYIPALVAKAREGFDVVLTRRQRRQSWFRRMMSEIFFRIFSLLADDPVLDRGIGAYSLINRRTADTLRGLCDVHANYLATVVWIGGRRTLLTVDARPRFAGRSSYTLAALVRLGVGALCGSSSKLLVLAFGLGLAYLLAAAAGLLFLAARHPGPWRTAGVAPLAVLVLVSTGLILASIGIIGFYLGNVFDQVRGRPPYLVQARINLDGPRG